MFWKKKTDPDPDFQHIKIPKDSRRAYRISPSSLDPIILEFENDSTEVVDISSGGLSFKNLSFKGGETIKVKFTLPFEDEEIVGKLEILRVGDQNICHGKFAPATPHMENQIHKYVLQRQKEDLRFS